MYDEEIAWALVYATMYKSTGSAFFLWVDAGLFLSIFILKMCMEKVNKYIKIIENWIKHQIKIEVYFVSYS